ncbi:transposase [Candidatus Berkelbacteria bacterium]|nr:transposase [Candidatus Berkelbacteria bacterium]
MKTDLARALGFSRRLFYGRSAQEPKDRFIAWEIERLHNLEDDTLGHRKLAQLLSLGKNRVRRVMQKYGLAARRLNRKYQYPGRADLIHANLANDPSVRLGAAVIIFSDIFELKLADGSRLRGCFALRKDTRQILSLVFDYGMSQELVDSVIEHLDSQAMVTIFHSDQGKQYGAHKTITQLFEKGFYASMSRAGTPTDNAFAERFVGIFKHAVACWRLPSAGLISTTIAGPTKASAIFHPMPMLKETV